MDGERDPEVLALCFHIIPKMAKNSPQLIPYVAEELFDITSCYFPISFKTDPNDPRGIRSEDLAKGLRASLASTPHFAPFCIPFLLEKFSATSLDVKLETLRTLDAACKNFGRHPLVPFATEIWSTLRSEVIRVSDNVYLDELLVTMGSIAGVLCDGPDTRNKKLESISGLVDPVIKELQSPDGKFVPLYALMVKSACVSSEIACGIISEYLFSQLLNYYGDKVPQAKKNGVLITFSRILEGVAQHAKIVPKVLSEIDVIAQSCAFEDVLRNQAINVLTRLILFQTEQEAKKSVELIVNGLSNEETRESTLLSLEWTIGKNSTLVTSQILSPLMGMKNLDVAIDIFAYFGKNTPSITPFLFDLMFASLKSNPKSILNGISQMISSAPLDSKMALQHLKQLLSYDIQEASYDKICLFLMKSCSENDQIEILANVKTLKPYLILPLYPSIKIEDMNLVLENYVVDALGNDDEKALIACQVVSSILNKQVKAESFLNAIYEQIIKSRHPAHAIQLTAWIVKGLLTAGKYQLMQAPLNQIYKWLQDKNAQISGWAALAFGVVLRDDETISKSTHCTVGVLYKQRFFTMNTNLLLESLKNGANETHVLFALSNMVGNVPNAVLLNEIDNLHPLVVRAITSSNQELILAGLKTLSIFIVQARQKLENGFGSLLRVVLDLMKHKENAEIRHLALCCLIEFSKYTYQLLFPYFDEIMETIDFALDDPKRSVRTEVAKCKNLYLDLLPKTQ